MVEPPVRCEMVIADGREQDGCYVYASVINGHNISMQYVMCDTTRAWEYLFVYNLRSCCHGLQITCLHQATTTFIINARS